jgi:hypothetical protein
MYQKCVLGLGSYIKKASSATLLSRCSCFTLSWKYASRHLLANVRWRSNPCNSATEVANSIVLGVALGAQGSELAKRPFLVWDAVGSQAIITIATCDQAAIDARPAERPAPREGLQRGTPSHCVRTIHDVAALRHCVEGLFTIYWLEAEEHYQD